MKLLLISPKNRTVYNFRGDLVKDLQKKGYSVSVTGPNQDDIERVKALGVEFFELPMNKNGTNIFKDFKYMISLYKLMKSQKPDTVFAYTVKPVIYGSIAAKLAGVKNINAMITGAGYAMTTDSFKAKLLGIVVKTLYKIAFSCSNKVIFQNPDDLNEFVEGKLVKKCKAYVVNGSGVNMDSFTKAELPDQVNFLMISRFLKSKGVGDYLEAAKIVKAKYPEAKFSLLGKYEYDMSDALPQDYIEEFINNGIVELYGETNDVREYYKSCSVFVLPSYYREGTPRTILEALATGRPIITTDSIGCRETVIDGENGFMVPIKNPQALAEKMEWVIENQDKLPLLAQKSYEYCKAKYDVNLVNQTMIEIIEHS